MANLSKQAIQLIDLAAHRADRGEYVDLVEIITDSKKVQDAAKWLVLNGLCEVNAENHFVITDKGRAFVADSKR